MSVSFDDPGLLEWLKVASADDIDQVAFGVIGMTAEGNVAIYNQVEAEYACLTRERVMGRHLFSEVAPCTNNVMVAQRYETEAEIDATLDYVFTLRMKFTPVKLRLLKRSDSPLRYMLVVRV